MSEGKFREAANAGFLPFPAPTILGPQLVKLGPGSGEGERKRHGRFGGVIMDYQKILIGALGTLETGSVFTRKQVHDAMVDQGYAERTAHNALTPSRKGGMINALLADGVIEAHGPRGYRIVDNSRFKEKPKANAGRVTYYAGTPRDGYRGLGLMSDTNTYEAELLMCGERFASGCWNLKLYADGRMPHKANWWMQYRNGVLAGKDAATLKATKPDVYANIIADMKEIEASYD